MRMKTHLCFSKNYEILFLLFSEPKGTILPLLVEPRAEKLRKLQRHAWVGEHVLLPCVAQGFPVPETT